MKKLLTLCILAASVSAASALEIDYKAELYAGGSGGSFAPSLIGSGHYGRTAASGTALLDLSAEKRIDSTGLWNWGAGVDFFVGYRHGVTYMHYSPETQGLTDAVTSTPKAAHLQQLYGQIRYRAVQLELGMRQRCGKIVNPELSSGDLIYSNNAAPIPGVSLGFNTFQNIPFTKGWVQIAGDIFYGKMMDSKYQRQQANQYDWVLATDRYYTYKYCYFRSNPNKRFYATLGMQTAGLFGGESTWFRNGVVTDKQVRGFKFKDLWKMFFPHEGNDGSYYTGSTLGSWNFRADYELPRSLGHLAAYFEGPWEDGSGIGRLNGWDGLYGIEWTASARGPVTAVVAEYLDFTNQSGPIHWAPADNPGTTITSHASGADNYYNNDVYGPFCNYGLALGTPFLVAPYYNLNGQPAFMHTRARGCHLAVKGHIMPELEYVVKYEYEKAYGDGRHPIYRSVEGNAAMLKLKYNAGRFLKGLSASLTVAQDWGKLREKSHAGALLTISYNGVFTPKRK